MMIANPVHLKGSTVFLHTLAICTLRGLALGNRARGANVNEWEALALQEM